MPRGVVDYEGLKSPASQAIHDLKPRPGRPFNLSKIGHVVLMECFTLEEAVANPPPGQDVRGRLARR